jgi:hypothetical protein
MALQTTEAQRFEIEVQVHLNIRAHEYPLI